MHLIFHRLGSQYVGCRYFSFTVKQGILEHANVESFPYPHRISCPFRRHFNRMGPLTAVILADIRGGKFSSPDHSQILRSDLSGHRLEWCASQTWTVPSSSYVVHFCFWFLITALYCKPPILNNRIRRCVVEDRKQFFS